MVGKRGLLSWMGPSMAEYTYTVILKPKPIRTAAQAVIKKMIPPRMEFRGIQLALNQSDAIVCGALTLGCYERFEVEVAEQLFQAGMTVLDVGANIGLYSAVAAKSVGAGGRVISVEPDVTNCGVIHRTIALNGYQNVQVVQKAVSDKTRSGALFLCADNKADHRIYDRPGVRQQVPVEFITVDDLLAQLGVSRVDFLKMDIQGAELLALQGMKQTLAANGNIMILLEFWPWGILQTGGKPIELLAGFRELGFKLHLLNGDQRRISEVTNDAELAGQVLERQHANLLLSRRALPELKL